MRRTPTIVAFALLVSCDLQSQATPARMWREMGEVRSLYVMGLIDGAFLSQVQLKRFVAGTTVQRAWLRQPPAATVPVDSAFASFIHQFVSANANAVSEGMTRLYEEQANSCLSWSTVAWAAIEVLQGASAQRREEFLLGARRATGSGCSAR